MAVLNNSSAYFNASSKPFHFHKDYSRPFHYYKDYSRPLHVDCSVEYELPNSAKPPVGVINEPLLMIHPSYYLRDKNFSNNSFINNVSQKMKPNNSINRVRGSQITISYYPQQLSSDKSSKRKHMSENKTTRLPLTCSNKETVNLNPEVSAKFLKSTGKNSIIAPSYNTEVQKQDQPTINNTRLLTVMKEKDSNTIIAGILPPVYQEINNNCTMYSKINKPNEGEKVSSYCMDENSFCFVLPQHKNIYPISYPELLEVANNEYSYITDNNSSNMYFDFLNKRIVPWSKTSYGPQNKRRKLSCCLGLQENSSSFPNPNFNQWYNNILSDKISFSHPSNHCNICQNLKYEYTCHNNLVNSCTSSCVFWNNENMLELLQV